MVFVSSEDEVKIRLLCVFLAHSCMSLMSSDSM